jgi:hypothetical protein
MIKGAFGALMKVGMRPVPDPQGAGRSIDHRCRGRPTAHRPDVSPYFDEIRSTSNTSVAFGGITPPAPRAP